MPALVGLVLLHGHAAYAKQPATAISSSRQILSSYIPPSSALPSELRLDESSDDLPNFVVAFLAQQPTGVDKIIARGRLDGLIQAFARSDGAKIVLRLSLFRESDGARADLTDPVELGATFNLKLTEAPPLRDASAGFSSSSDTGAVIGVGFVSGRLEVLISATGISQADLMPLATVMAAQTLVPPPPATAEELAFLQVQTDSESILYDAFIILHGSYFAKPSPAAILGAAYDGAVAVLGRAGIDGLPPPPQVTASGEEDAWSQFLPGYRRLASRAGTSSRQDLAHAAVAAMFSSLNNCHTLFLSPRIYRLYASDNLGQVGAGGTAETGIDLSLFPDGRYIIVRVLSGSPADGAGLVPGEELAAINGQTPAQLNELDWESMLRGDVGQPVTLTVLRVGGSAPFEIELKLGSARLTGAQSPALPAGIGYIELDAFPFGNADIARLRNSIADAISAGGVNGWILDLRYNRGGGVAGMRDIASLFVPLGSQLITRASRIGVNGTIRTPVAPPPEQKPLVILTSTLTASTAEMFSQSLRDLGRASIVGSTTAGCVNGGLAPGGLLDGSGVFVSTFEVLSGPNKVALEGVGVSPDVPVTLTRSDLSSGSDPVVAAAVSFLIGAPTPSQTAR